MADHHHTTTKQLIAIAAAHVTRYPHCIRSHTKTALSQGVTPEIVEAIRVAAEMCAGSAYAHSAVAIETIAASAKQAARPA